MDKLADLKDLLRHEIEDLYSAEQQITGALPDMIVTAASKELKKTLEEHLFVTQTHRARLDKVLKLLRNPGKDNQEPVQRKFLSGLFGGSTRHKCLGMEGLIKEGKTIMKEKMNPEVMDAAILACAQKIEHYEICGYGTARAYAKELNLQDVEQLLTDTLDEEYAADEQLTKLAVQGGLNQTAEQPSKTRKTAPRKKATTAKAKATKKTPNKAAQNNDAKKETPLKKTPQKNSPVRSKAAGAGSIPGK